MNTKLTIAAGLITATVMLTAQPAMAHDDGPPPHGHMLILGLELDERGSPTGFRKCVDIAANRPVPLHAHHAGLHTGRAGTALQEAGHYTLATAPLDDWDDCADLIADFGG